ncbi:OFA family MFS transporter [soil metagenome]
MATAPATGGRTDHPTLHGLDSGRAWVVVGATFLSTFTVFGVVYSFGAFFDSMAADFGTGKGATALMFSFTTAWYFGLGLVSGKAADRFGPRPVLIFGAAALGVGLLATSRVDSIWWGYVTYGLGAGTAVACGYVPMVATVGGWFERRRTLALGIAVAGIGAGTLACAPLASALIDAHGWRTAYVVFGIGGTALMLVAAVGAHRPPVVLGSAPVNLRRIVRQRPFVALYVGALLGSMALFIPFVFIKSYATDQGIDSRLAATLVGIIGASSIVGRLGLGALGSRFGAIRLMQSSFGLMAASYLLWLVAGGSFAVLVVFTVVMGVGYGGFIALSPAVVATLFGTVGMGAILGATYTAAGVGGLVGPPIAGELIDRVSYDGAIVFAMVLTAAATAVMLAIPTRAQHVTASPLTDGDERAPRHDPLVP